MSTTKEYFAFISYQRKDEKIADELRHKLEHYHLPSSIRKENPSFPKTIYPIFRDSLELSGGVLSEQIEQALEQSKFLIVVSSPNSAKSPWVNKEVQTFIRMGKERKIIPFIIDGEPNSENPNTECFPPALRELTGSRELLGININELGREAAAVKVVACMFGLKFDSLWQRFQREQRRKKWMMIGGAILFALVSLVIGLYIARKNVELDAANWQMKINQARAVAEKASQLVDEGDSYLARLLALEILPKDLNNPDRPYVPEAEAALRKALNNDLMTLNMHYSNDPYRAFFTSDSKYLVVLHPLHKIELWDIKTGEKYKEIEDEKMQWMSKVAISPNNKYLVTINDDESLNLWDVDNETNLGSFNSQNHHAKPIVFLDDKYLLSSSWDDNMKLWSVKLWNVVTKSEVKSFIGHKSEISDIQLSPNKKYMASSSYYDGTIILWDFDSQMLLDTLSEDKCSIHKLQFSPDNNYLFSISDSTKMWDIRTGAKVKSFDVSSSISPDCKYIVDWGGDSPSYDKYDDASITVVKISSEEEIFSLDGYRPIFSFDAKYLAYGDLDNSINILNISENRVINTIKGHTSIVNLIAFSPDGKYIASISHDNSVKISETGIFEKYKTIRPYYFSSNNSDLLSPNKKYVMSDDFTDLSKIIDVKLMIELEGFSGSYVISPDAQYVVSYRGDSLSLWNTDRKVAITESLGHEDGIMTVVFSPNSQYFISTSWDKTIKLWDVVDGCEIRRFKGHNDGVISAAFSSDGQYIASVSWDNTMKLWDVNEEKEIFTFSEYTGGAHSVMFSSNDRIITISENYIMNWDVKNRKLISSQWLSSPISSSVSFSRDKKFLLELDEKGTGIVLRDVNSGDEILKLKGHEEWLSEVSFSNDGNYIISRYRNGIINVWPYKPLQELIDETYERFINRPLVQEERQKYYLE